MAMNSKIAALILLSILPLGVGAQTVWVFPDPYQSWGGAIVDGIEAGQRFMQRQQEMEDRRRQRDLDRQEQLERMERHREVDQEERDMAEQRRQLQQLRTEIESQRAAAREPQSAGARVTSTPPAQSPATTVQRSGEPLRCGPPYAAACLATVAAAKPSARDVPIRDDPEGQKWCGEQSGIVSDDGMHCRLP
jgi:TolA-binding protein